MWRLRVLSLCKRSAKSSRMSWVSSSISLRMSVFASRTVLGTHAVASFDLTMNCTCAVLWPMVSMMASEVRLRFRGEGHVSW